MDHLKPNSLDKEYYNNYKFINYNIKCITESNEITKINSELNSIMK